MANEIHRIRIAAVCRAMRPLKSQPIVFGDSLSIAVADGERQLRCRITAIGLRSEDFQVWRVCCGQDGRSHEGGGGECGVHRFHVLKTRGKIVLPLVFQGERGTAFGQRQSATAMSP